MGSHYACICFVDNLAYHTSSFSIAGIQNCYRSHLPACYYYGGFYVQGLIYDTMRTDCAGFFSIPMACTANAYFFFIATLSSWYILISITLLSVIGIIWDMCIVVATRYKSTNRR